MVVTDYNEQFLDKRGTDHLIDELKAYIDNLPTGGVDLSDYVTKSELQAKLDALDINIDLSAYATKEELTQAINSIDLSSYAKKTDIPSLDAYAKKSDIPSLEGYVTETELNAKGYLTEHQDLSAYALKTEIPSLDGLATTEYVDNAIANVPSGGNVDLSNYYTKAETNALIPSLEGYATKEYVSTAINSIPTTDLSNYYTKSETYSKTEVNTLVANSGGGGSSSGGITYAFDTEIATGDTWVDGKPIYMRVINLTNMKPSGSSGYNLYMPVYKDWVINEVIDSRIALKNGASNYTTENPYQGQIGKTSNISTLISDINSYIITRGIYHNVIVSPTQTIIQVFIGTYYKEATKKIYLTVKYTKP